MKNSYVLEDAIGMIDEAIIAEAGNIAAIQKAARKRRLLTRVASIVLAFALILPTAVFIARVVYEKPISYDPYYLNALENPIVQSGKPHFTIRGDGPVSGSAGSPPMFEFALGGINVKAELIEVLPDTYTSPLSRPTETQSRYRFVRFRTLDVICGENIPETFLYRIPEYNLVDLTPYDFFYISLFQISFEHYTLYNETKGYYEQFDTIVFGDSHPELGNVIAFTDGVFDERLWQNQSWLYGYQFARGQLDREDETLLVKRGCTEDYTREKMERIYQEYPNYTKPASPKYTASQIDEIQKALAYVSDFKNGIFLQETNLRSGLRYRRYINGNPTDETVFIDFYKNEVTYSDTHYTEDDLKVLENLSMRIEEKERKYQENPPLPPHMDTDGKQLYKLIVLGWYAKVDGKVLGIVQTRWVYTTKREIWTFEYHDEVFTVYDAVNKTARDISREDLIALVGEQPYIYYREYGREEEVPLC